MYAQPVVIAPTPVAVYQRPIYLYVPPDHQHDWGRHCGRTVLTASPSTSYKSAGCASTIEATTTMTVPVATRGIAGVATDMVATEARRSGGLVNRS